MASRYGLIRQGSAVWRSLRDGDFEEEDVWDVLRNRKDSSSSSRSGKSIESSFSASRSLPTAARMIPRATAASSNSSSNNSSHETRILQQSAPVNIPDWSKICRKKTTKKGSEDASSWLHDDQDYDDCENRFGNDFGGYNDEEDEDYEDNEYNSKVPPHEFIARRLARSQISSSVFEGVGRTLKGRDLSKVRNAVLTKTGFLESL